MNHNIAIVGLPGSGKTAFLTRLIWRRKNNPLSRASFDFLEKQKRIFDTGNWNEWIATDPATKKEELKWEINRGGNRKFVLKFKDFSGEEWANFINQYGSEQKSPAPEAIGNFIANSVAVIICFDLKKILENQEEYINEKWMVHAVKNCLGSSGNIGLVITKWDAVRDIVKNRGGLEKVLKQILGNNIVNSFGNRIFQVSVAEFEFNPQHQMDMPIPGSVPTGFHTVSDWIFNLINQKEFKIASFSTAFLGFIVLLIAAFIWGNKFFSTAAGQWIALITIITGIIFCGFKLKKNLVNKRG